MGGVGGIGGIRGLRHSCIALRARPSRYAFGMNERLLPWARALRSLLRAVSIMVFSALAQGSKRSFMPKAYREGRALMAMQEWRKPRMPPTPSIAVLAAPTKYDCLAQVFHHP